MHFLESVIYGLMSGLAEFLPVSGQAHQVMCMLLFGRSEREPLRDFFVHIAIIVALFIADSSMFDRIRREKRLSSGRHRGSVNKTLLDIRLVRGAALPMVLLLFAYLYTGTWEAKPLLVVLLLIINGVILLIPEHMRHGNKDAMTISGVESLLIGAASGLSALPGISRIGCGLGISTACGASRQNSANWVLMLSVPALILYLLFDIINMFVIGFAGMTFLGFLGYIVSAITAFAGGYLSVRLLRLLSDRSGFSVFAYYSWGAALFTFVLFLMT